jgi:glycosyltransferase involved in cell wall biosynthesis
LRITFCWTHLSGYAAACFREFSKRPGIDLRVVAFTADSAAPFDDSGFSGFSLRLLSCDERSRYNVVRSLVAQGSPDVLVVSGWAHRPYTKLVSDPALRGVRLILAADTPLRFDWRQRIAPLWIGRYLRSFDAIAVPGERGYQVMRYWGVPYAKLYRGLYGIDYASMAPLLGRRAATAGGWPMRFLFMGRLIAQKGIETLVAAYGRYREQVDDPWPLSICGTGPLEDRLAAVPGIMPRGFLQPEQLLSTMLESGAFVLPSWIDPWPLVVAEAAASGLPIVCTQTCGSVAELVRDFHNGLIVPPKDEAALAGALVWIHRNHERLPDMGAASQALASAFTAERWAERWTVLATGAL